jgi:hypothetical protein
MKFKRIKVSRLNPTYPKKLLPRGGRGGGLRDLVLEAGAVGSRTSRGDGDRPELEPAGESGSYRLSTGRSSC